jgi:DNA-binding NarL/FixJ family response regulator
LLNFIVLLPQPLSCLQKNYKMQRSILVFDDHPLVFDGIRLQLAHLYDLHYAATGAQLRAKLAAGRFDIVLLDLDFPANESGFDYFDEIHASTAKIVVLTGTATTAKLRRCYDADLAGLLEKHDSTINLRETLDIVLAGHQVFPFSRVKRLLSNNTDRLPRLTSRERDVLDLMFNDPGLSHKQIAIILDISITRVSHLANQIAEKFQVHGLVRAWREAERRGYRTRTKQVGSPSSL